MVRWLSAAFQVAAAPPSAAEIRPQILLRRGVSLAADSEPVLFVTMQPRTRPERLIRLTHGDTQRMFVVVAWLMFAAYGLVVVCLAVLAIRRGSRALQTARLGAGALLGLNAAAVVFLQVDGWTYDRVSTAWTLATEAILVLVLVSLKLDRTRWGLLPAIVAVAVIFTLWSFSGDVEKGIDDQQARAVRDVTR